MNYLNNLTPEQRAEALEKAKKAKQEKRELGLKLYKQNWLEDPLWQELAKKSNIKLPQSHMAPSVSKLKKYAKAIGLPEGWHLDFFGMKNISKALKLEFSLAPEGQAPNLRCYVGHLLELKHLH